MNNTPQSAEASSEAQRIIVGHKISTETSARRVFDDGSWHTLDGERIPAGKYREIVRTIEDKWLEPVPGEEGTTQQVSGLFEAR